MQGFRQGGGEVSGILIRFQKKSCAFVATSVLLDTICGIFQDNPFYFYLSSQSVTPLSGKKREREKKTLTTIFQYVLPITRPSVLGAELLRKSSRQLPRYFPCSSTQRRVKALLISQHNSCDFQSWLRLQPVPQPKPSAATCRISKHLNLKQCKVLAAAELFS